MAGLARTTRYGGSIRSLARSFALECVLMRACVRARCNLHTCGMPVRMCACVCAPRFKGQGTRDHRVKKKRTLIRAQARRDSLRG